MRHGFPLESEVERIAPGAHLAVAEATLRELDRLVRRATPGAEAARALAARYPARRSDARGDAAVVEIAVRDRMLVVTADQDLQDRLVARGVGVLVPRDRHRLELRPPRRPTRPVRRRRGNG